MDTGTDKILLAAYGTLRQGWGNASAYLSGKDVIHIGTGVTVEKYTMRASGIPYVSKKPTSQIVIDLWSVDKSTLTRVDALEGHPEWYVREEIPVIVDGKEYKAWLYFNEGSNANIIANGDFNSVRKNV